MEMNRNEECQGTGGKRRNPDEGRQSLPEGLSIREPARDVPVIAQTGVLVVGGGTAGAVAAIAAARSGVETLLVESSGALGGSATNGLVTPMMSVGIEGSPLCSGISDEINLRLSEMGYGGMDKGHASFFDPEMLKFVLEEMAVESGVRLLYYTSFVGAVVQEGAVRGVVVENKAGRGAILARCAIDCTGDGDVCVRAGVSFESGHPDTGRNQPISVRYMMVGIDIGRFVAFLKTLDPNYACSLPFLHTAMVWNKGWALSPLFRKAYEAGELTWEDGLYWQVFGVPGQEDALAFNCPEVFDRVDGTNPEDLTHAQVYAKRSMLRLLGFYRADMPGFEKAYISQVAPMVGVRETRRIHCAYRLSDEDVLLRRKFEDHVARSNYPIDIHGLDLVNRDLDGNVADPEPWYEIPYRCLVVKGVDRLLVAGRCISSSFAAQATLRIQPTVRALGEAAGIAAALCVREGVSPSAIDGAAVRAEMIRRGARF